MYLERINSPADLKKLGLNELVALAGELRDAIIKQVSVSGGHLASNLGVIELTIALHYVFNTPSDKLVWDVGHQSYAHKLITGRREKFSTLRKQGGLSGFPRPLESAHDAFGVGHSSTSISAALGMIEARDKTGEDFKVIAIIGDGSMTAGLAFEGLNHAGNLKKDLIVILNDNEMSISRNVGALAAYLKRILVGEFYRKVKGFTRPVLESIPHLGQPVSRMAQRVEHAVRASLLPGGLFEELGFNYIGPVDGHDITAMIETLKKVKGERRPVLIHAVTVKGKGYLPSEQDPCEFHGIGPFEVETGHKVGGPVSYGEFFGQTLTAWAEEEQEVVAITAAMKEGTGLTCFAERFPGRFYDVGIAEPHAAVFAAGLAKGGMRPVVAIYSTFLQRSFDAIIHDVCLQKLPVIFAIDRAGVVGEDGPTHHGMFDLSYLRLIPNLVVMAPKDAPELAQMLRLALDMRKSPVAIRYPRGKAVTLCPATPVEAGRAELIKEGGDISLLGLGSTVEACIKAAGMLAEEGINASVYNMRFLKPLDREAVRASARTGRIVTVEDNSVKGGFGSAVAETLFELGIKDISLKMLGFPDSFVEHGSQDALKSKYGLDAKSVCAAASSLVRSPGRKVF